MRRYEITTAGRVKPFIDMTVVASYADITRSVGAYASLVGGLGGSKSVVDILDSKSVVDSLVVSKFHRDAINAARSMTEMLDVSKHLRETIDAARLTPHKPLSEVLNSYKSISETLNISKSISEALRGYPRLSDIYSGPTWQNVMAAYEPLSWARVGPDVANLVATPKMPRAAWSGVLTDLRPGIGDDLYDDASSELATAAEFVATNSGRAWWWWIEKLPLSAQAGLLLLALEMLDKASVFVCDLTGQDVPPAFRSGTDAVFTLAFFIYAVMVEKTNVERPIDSDG